MKLKFNIGDIAFILGDKEILKSKITEIDIKEDGIKYKLDGVYHMRDESSLFSSFEDIIEYLRENITEPKSIKDKAKSTFEQIREKVNI